MIKTQKKDPKNNVVTNVKNPNNPIPNSTPFTRDYQPDPEAKKAGWERKRVRQSLMDVIMANLDRPIEEVKERLERVLKEKNTGVTLLEAIGMKYAHKAFMDDKFLTDLMDRHIEKAPQKLEHGGEDGGPVLFGWKDPSKSEEPK